MILKLTPVHASVFFRFTELTKLTELNEKSVLHVFSKYCSFSAVVQTRSFERLLVVVTKFMKNILIEINIIISTQLTSFCLQGMVGVPSILYLPGVTFRSMVSSHFMRKSGTGHSHK